MILFNFYASPNNQYNYCSRLWMKEVNFKEGHRARTREPGIQSLEDEAETLNGQNSLWKN